jgi:hypothetical protein
MKMKQFIALVGAICFALATQNGCAAVSAASTASDPNEIRLNLLSIDQYTGTLKSRATLVFPESAMTSSFDVKNDYFLVEKNTVGNSIYKISKNVPYAALNSTLTLQNEVSNPGVQFLYPFDTHVARLKFFVSKDLGDGTVQPLPVKIDCTNCSFGGYNLAVDDSAKNADLSKDVLLTIRRDLPDKIFSIFINIAMITIAIFVLIMASRLAANKYRPESSTLGFIGGLLFALPAVRNLQPNVPVVGVLLDYFGFFEAEFIVAASLVLALTAWIMKPEKPYGWALD